MALNIRVFKTRALTALLFVAVMLTGLLWNFWSFLVLVTIIHFGCWFEFVKLMKKIYAGKYLVYCLAGLIYITMPCIMMFSLQKNNMYIFSNDPYGASCLPVVDTESLRFTILLFTVFVIWINDTMAYIVGSFIGKTPFSGISPKKTWEGTVGGVILAIAVGVLIAWVWGFNIFQVAVITVIITNFGTAGDLLESKLKRVADVKDSGRILPGHGGFLDRFDSLLIAVPLVWLYVFLYLK